MPHLENRPLTPSFGGYAFLILYIGTRSICVTSLATSTFFVMLSCPAFFGQNPDFLASLLFDN